MGFSERAGVETGLHVESPEGLMTNVGTPHALDTGEQEAAPVQPGMKTVAGPSSATDGGVIPTPASDTARQQPAQTAGQLGGVPVQVSGEALTEPLPAYFEKLRSEEERQRVEALRRQQEEEEQRRRDEEQRREAEESARREAEERARLEAAERARRETEERERREAEERQRREAEESARRGAEERARREAEERSRREEAERAAALAAQQQAEQAARQQAEEAARQQQAALAAQQQQAAIATQQQQSGAGHAQSSAQSGGAVAPSPSRLVPILVGSFVALVLLAGMVGGAAYYFRDSDIVKRLLNLGGGNTNSNVSVNTNNASNTNAGVNANTGTNTNGAANGNANTNPKQTGADLVELPGGSFKMGRDDVPPLTDELMKQRQQYALWMYNQWPAHPVTVRPFAIDRTEVTNAEYAEFVKETGQQPPANWGGSRPKAGEEQLPVTDVSYDDAVAFATWRSRRDGVLYRLPTEDEWEYAARGGGDPTRLYPWGGKWEDGRANLGTNSLRPVGSFPQGNTPQGVADMIGNVWEWTASKASMYEGNNKSELKPADRGKIVVRGGAYTSKPDGDEPVTVTSRTWLPHDQRDQRVGFRLVRAGT
jgi:formylglycine-generating enzyme required for sulfatase activity